MTDNEDRAERAEQQKQEQLKKQKEGKGEWTDTLASDSESIVCFACRPCLRQMNSPNTQ